MEKKIGIIVNPIAGRQSKDSVVKALKLCLDTRNGKGSVSFTYDIWETKEWRHAVKLAQHAESNHFSDLIIIGGDGSLHEAVNGLSTTEVAVSVIPMGTGNDFVKSIEWPKILDKQVDAILKGSSRLIDVGVCNGHKFINTMGFGFDGQVVDFMDRNGKQFQGHLAYLYTVINLLFSYKEPTASMRIGDKKLQAPVFMGAVNNGTTFGGGFLITPEAKIDDGLLDLCLIEKLKVWERLLHLPKVQRGKHQQVKGVSFYQMKEMHVEASKQIIGQIDGEYLGHPPFDISILPKALRIRCV